MALSVVDILKLPIMSGFKLLAGGGGLSKAVISAGIADYEFVLGNDFELSNAFERDSMVISSLLFAKDNPDIIIDAIKLLHSSGVSAFAYKPVIFNELPDEVLNFADENDFPVFSFARNIWFENIIFDIMNAVELDDALHLSESHIKGMISGTASGNELECIRSGISLLLKKTVSAAYIRASESEANRIYRLYYVAKGLRDKLLVSKYDGGLFFLITTDRTAELAHRLILEEANNILSFPQPPDSMVLSRIHDAGDFSDAFREAYFSCLAGMISSKENLTYDMLGVYTSVLALAETSELRAFSKDYLSKLRHYDDTIASWVKNGGDIVATSIDLHCHANTVRYRLSKIKETVGAPNETDNELFRDLSIAYVVKAAKEDKR